MTNQEAKEKWGEFIICPLGCGSNEFKGCDLECCKSRPEEERGFICQNEYNSMAFKHHFDHQWVVKKQQWELASKKS